MASVLFSNLCLLLLLSAAESCFLPKSLYIPVPQTVEAGQHITKVNLADCGDGPVLLSVSDPSFTVYSDGEIVAVRSVSVSARGQTFSVEARDGGGQWREMEVHLIRAPEQPRKTGGQGLLKRSKRRWSPPTFHILEEDDGPYPRDIHRIVSDSEAQYNVYYRFSGPGFDKYPTDVFSLDRETAMLRVHKKVDREMFPKFTLETRVIDKNTEKDTDVPLSITIEVDDINDNAPTFTNPLQFTVPEKSKAGEVVGKVNATDRDKEGTRHVKIRYTLLDGLDLFAINPETGVITTRTNTLDREAKDKHLATVQIKDMDGAVNGLVNTGTATITLTDINDNPPTFLNTPYTATVTENEIDKLILRIPVEDKDLINTPNWISKFVITKGNENGNFRIDTDPKTNEGLLYVTKGLDYEKSTNVKLEITARNEADLSGTSAQWQSAPVDVTVTNVDEGPQFTAPTVTFTVRENVANGTLIGSYTAVDPESKNSKGISYYKVEDPASWINVDKNSGELRVANTIDRESHFVQDGKYNITMKAVDASSKTGTGTVIIVVEDVNDNMPKVPSKLVMCEKPGELGSVMVLAEDPDQSPYSAPFSFSLPSDNDGKWSVTPFNDTAAMLKQVKELHTGIHDVELIVTDLQGYGQKQIVPVRICQCRNGVCLAKDHTVSLGGLALLTMLLPLALLLLLGLLLAFFCVTKRQKLEIDDVGDSGGILLKSNIEAPGDEVDLIAVPTAPVEQLTMGSVKGAAVNAGWLGNKSSSTIGGHSVHENGMYTSGVVKGDTHEFYSAQYDSNLYSANQFNGGHLLGSGVDFDNRYLQDTTFLRTWQTNGRYLHQKLSFMGTEDDGRYADDIVHAYGFEGAGSTAGSVGCCSDYADNDDLDFLNTLGPKFKTLADVCTKS
ncbi:desmocollin 2 like isoform X2 [Acanthopagrus latus]|uniref:desmocollin 2 like isoform X2 n=1 Tax=Acanthopagrus latus TaxID=8177 RepID=UPI00187C9526|nr:desmocollin 2 like isoform X2 [Acanthopagrus latus]